MTDIASMTLNDKELEKLSLITRQFVLSTLSFAVSQICYVTLMAVVGVRWADTEFDAHAQNVTIVVLFAVFYPSEIVTNFAALYLNNRFSKGHYERCCKPCHECCSRCVMCCVSKQLAQKHPDEFEDIKENTEI